MALICHTQTDRKSIETIDFLLHDSVFLSTSYRSYQVLSLTLDLLSEYCRETIESSFRATCSALRVAYNRPLRQYGQLPCGLQDRSNAADRRYGLRQSLRLG